MISFYKYICLLIFLKGVTSTSVENIQNKTKSSIGAQNATSTVPLKVESTTLSTVPTDATAQNLNSSWSLGNFSTSETYLNKGALFRTFIVLSVVLAIIIVFLGMKTLRSSKRHSKSRKYGIITSAADIASSETEPLEDGDEDEDTTLFDAHQIKYNQK